MNKNVLTNLTALALVLLGWWLTQPVLLSIGLFALAGAITNTLAIHMLFEKVPLLAGDYTLRVWHKDLLSESDVPKISLSLNANTPAQRVTLPELVPMY
ncbi:hypothetical protein [Alishewanella longhuensis]